MRQRYWVIAALAASGTENERSQRRTQVLAQEQNYARIEAEYNARLRNAFEAGLVAPPDVPRTAPSLAANKQRVCADLAWCRDAAHPRSPTPARALGVLDRALAEQGETE